MTIQLQDFHLNSLQEATNLLKAEDIEQYVQLRRLLPDLNRPDVRRTFEKKFARYYRFGQARVGEEFRQTFFPVLYRYFQHLPDEPYGEPLLHLYQLPNEGGRLHCCFVSKLVATVDESRPVWDVHVRTFLGVNVEAGGDMQNRIAGFLALITLVRRTYREWLDVPAIAQCVADARGICTGMAEVDSVRILDLLVWTVGRNRRIARDVGK